MRIKKKSSVKDSLALCTRQKLLCCFSFVIPINAMADSNNVAQPAKTPSKDAPKLNPPKDDLITTAYLAECNGTVPVAILVVESGPAEFPRSDKNNNVGTDPEKPTYVAIMGTVFDVSGNQSYAPGGSYHGKTAPFL
jgi:hypothetical protein